MMTPLAMGADVASRCRCRCSTISTICNKSGHRRGRGGQCRSVNFHETFCRLKDVNSVVKLHIIPPVNAHEICSVMSIIIREALDQIEHKVRLPDQPTRFPDRFRPLMKFRRAQFQSYSSIICAWRLCHLLPSHII